MFSEDKTPIKIVPTQPQSTQTKFRICLLCRRNLIEFKKYYSVTVDIAKTLSSATGISLRYDQDLAQQKICGPCNTKLGNVEKWREVGVALRETLAQVVEKRTPVSASSRAKRMSKATDSPTTQQARAKKKGKSSKQLSFDEFTSMQLELRTGSGTVEVLHVPLTLNDAAYALGKGDLPTAMSKILEAPGMDLQLQNLVGDKISSECGSVCSTKVSSAFRSCSKEALQSWSYEEQEHELQQKAPMFLTCLKAAGVNPRISGRNKMKTYDSVQPCIMSAAGVLLYARNEHMNAHQTMTALQVRRGGGGSRCIERLKARGLSIAYNTFLQRQVDFGHKFDEPVLQWKETVEQESKVESGLKKAALSKPSTSELEQHNKTRHPGYKLNGDNVDLHIRPRQITMTTGSKDLHYFQVIAIKNRITDYSLQNDHPRVNIDEAHLSVLLPSVQDNASLRQEWIALTGRVIAAHVPTLSWFGSFVPKHINHKYIHLTSKKTEVVNLGVLTENENTNEGIVNILDHLNKYVPQDEDSNPIPIICGGDLLTCEREMNAKLDRQDSSSPTARWDGLVPVIEDFHTMANYLEAIWKLLYSTASARDTGTMYNARNYLKAHNVSKEPMRDVNASVEFLEKYTDALIICAALEYFGMDSIDSEPSQNVFDMMTTEPTQYVNDNLGKLIDKFSFHEGPEFDNVDHAACPHCEKSYKTIQGLRNHIRKKHAGSGNQPPSTSSSSHAQDSVFNYSCAALSMGLLFKDFEDARRHGDGERLLKLYKFLLLYFKLTGKTKYSYQSLRLLAQVNILLSPRLAHQLTWNRCVNNAGKVDSNVESDREIEHHNKVFKEECRQFHGKINPNSVRRVSHSAQPSEKVLQQCDKVSLLRTRTATHQKKDQTLDVQNLAQKMHGETIFKEKIPRHHSGYPSFHKNLLQQLDLKQFQVWVRDKVQEFAAEQRMYTKVQASE